MIGGPASGDGGLDLLAVQRDDELLGLLGARTAVTSDDDLVRLLVLWRNDVDDGLMELAPTPRSAPGAATGPTAAAAGRPGAEPLRDGDARRPHRRRLTAAGTAAAVVLGGTLSLSGVAAAVTGDPLAPYRAVGSALSIGGEDLPDSAAKVAHLNKRLSRARAALAHGQVEDVQAVIDQLTAELRTADLTDEQRAALEHRLSSLQAAVDRATAVDTEKGRSADRGRSTGTRGGAAKATPTTPQRKEQDKTSTPRGAGEPAGTTTATKPEREPEARSDTRPTSKATPTSRAVPTSKPESTTDVSDAEDTDETAGTADLNPSDGGEGVNGGDPQSAVQTGAVAKSSTPARR
jgi:hypothetical protein